MIASCYGDHGIFVDAFGPGAGVGWHEHDDRLFSGVLRLFRPGYAAHLVDDWLPALNGVGSVGGGSLHSATTAQVTLPVRNGDGALR